MTISRMLWEWVWDSDWYWDRDSNLINTKISGDCNSKLNFVIQNKKWTLKLKLKIQNWRFVSATVCGPKSDIMMWLNLNFVFLKSEPYFETVCWISCQSRYVDPKAVPCCDKT